MRPSTPSRSATTPWGTPPAVPPYAPWRGIAGGVPQGVVQLLEVIEVRIDQRRDRGRLAPVLGQRALELAPVAEARERVAHRPLLRLEHRACSGKAGSQLRDKTLQVVRDR